MVRLTDRPDMTLDVYRGRKTTIQLTLLHSERPKLYTILVFVSAIGLKCNILLTSERSWIFVPDFSATDKMG